MIFNLAQRLGFCWILFGAHLALCAYSLLPAAPTWLFALSLAGVVINFLAWITLRRNVTISEVKSKDMEKLGKLSQLIAIFGMILFMILCLILFFVNDGNPRAYVLNAFMVLSYALLGGSIFQIADLNLMKLKKEVL